LFCYKVVVVVVVGVAAPAMLYGNILIHCMHVSVATHIAFRIRLNVLRVKNELYPYFPITKVTA
jgi:hypothetical protein